jgi:hypothetical protein
MAVAIGNGRPDNAYQVIIHAADGRVEDERTYQADPNPPAG